MRLMRQSDIV